MGRLDEFLEIYPSRGTQSTHRHALKKYFTSIYPNAKPDANTNTDRVEYQLADCARSQLNKRHKLLENVLDKEKQHSVLQSVL